MFTSFHLPRNHNNNSQRPTCHFRCVASAQQLVASPSSASPPSLKNPLDLVAGAPTPWRHHCGRVLAATLKKIRSCIVLLHFKIYDPCTWRLTEAFFEVDFNVRFVGSARSCRMLLLLLWLCVSVRAWITCKVQMLNFRKACNIFQIFRLLK